MIWRLPVGFALGALALSLNGCPNTELPPYGAGGGTRTCTGEELLAFQTSGFEDERSDLWIAFVDVGHGDATWIRTPGTIGVDAQEILVDTGNCRIMDGDCGLPPGTVNDESTPDGVGALIDFMGLSGLPGGSRLDYVVASHPDKDHYGGLFRVAEAYQIGALVDSGIASDQITYVTAIDRVLEEPGIVPLLPAEITGLDARNPGTADHPGLVQTGAWGRGVTVTLLSADRTAQDDNEGSVVLMVDYLGVKVLLTGDAEGPLDERLAAQWGVDLEADVLRAGHHGGVGTSTNALLDRVFPGSGGSPRYAVVSAGQRDGLPREDTLARLEAKVGGRVYRTDRNDTGKDQVAAPGDDHILLRISEAGEVSICYAFPDSP